MTPMQNYLKKSLKSLTSTRKNQNFIGNAFFKKWCNYCRRYGHSIAECRQKQKDNQNKLQNYREANKSFHQYMKKDQNLTKTSIVIIVQENYFRTTQVTPATINL